MNITLFKEGKPWSKVHVTAVALAVLLLVTAISFYPSLGNGFINWDDDTHVTENRSVQSLSMKNIQGFFTRPFNGIYQPLVPLSFAVEYHFFKLEARAYHTTNLILHLFNCLLVFWMLFLLGRNCPAALIAALFFAIHPLRVQSVAWIVERKDLLFTLFYLASLVCYIYSQRSHSKGYYGLTFMFFILSLLAKPMAVTLPVILILYDAVYLQRFNRESMGEKIPFFAASLVLAGIVLSAKNGGMIQGPSFPCSIPLAAYVLLFYVAAFLFPSIHSFYYPYPEALRTSVPSLFLGCLALAAALIICLALWAKRSRPVAFGGFFFLITLLPVLQIVPIPNYELVAERYTYLPSIGLAYLSGAAFSWLYERAGKKGKPGLVILLVLVMGLLASLTWQRCTAWKSSLTFWSHVISRNPEIPYAWNNRGNAYSMAAEYTRAQADYDRALELSPGYGDAYFNRAICRERAGDCQGALADYDRAIALSPTMAKAYVNRGALHLGGADFPQALRDLDKAIALNPGMAKAYNNRGTVYARMGDFDRALADYQSAIALDTRQKDAWINRGMLYLVKGELEKSLDDFNTVLSQDQENLRALSGRALIYMRMNKYEEAWGDVKTMENMGYTPEPELIRQLQERSGRRE